MNEVHKYCSKVLPLISIQEFRRFIVPKKKVTQRFFLIIILISSVILVFKSSRSLTAVLQIFLLRCSHRKKSDGLRFGDREADDVGPPLPIHLLLKTSLCQTRTALEKCDDSSICLKKNYFFHLSNRQTNKNQISLISFIQNMLHSLQLKIKTVILIGKLRFHISV